MVTPRSARGTIGRCGLTAPTGLGSELAPARTRVPAASDLHDGYRIAAEVFDPVLAGENTTRGWEPTAGRRDSVP